MAYVSQQLKQSINAQLKPALKGSGVKYSLRVRHHSTLVMTLYQGPDFQAECEAPRYHGQAEEENNRISDINVYHAHRWWPEETDSGKLIRLILPILNAGNWDRSDIMTDYFNVGWYVEIKLGRRWDGVDYEPVACDIQAPHNTNQEG